MENSTRGRSDPIREVANKNDIDRPRDKTTDAGESPEWGKGHGDKYGQRIASITKEIIVFEPVAAVPGAQY